ncbi:T9SS type A sorting domain-containing protein [Phaeodactylibacter xiamenensis]|uniref:T9SS type A sorting domain-containing protein n=1 Tax=Phaeodactylibacter xiamenensis TaxID=1524460 RepID=UPI0024A8096F|nr:T9SS type A sorting domain-containing protein [Phaeodactylibacter xiamenensis]
MSKDLFLSDNNRAALFYEQESNPKHLEVKPIKMNDLWSFQNNGSFEFSLPDIEAPIYAFAKRPRRYSDRDYIWSGEIYSEEGQLLGDVVFAQEKDKKIGRINIGDRRFMIRDLGTELDDDQVLIGIDKEKVVGRCYQDEVFEEEEVLMGPNDGDNEEVESCDAIISILILYSQEVLDAGIDYEQEAILGVADLNTALAESAIPNTNVSAEIAGYELLEGYEEMGNAIAARGQLEQNPNIPALRDEYNADLVVLFQVMDFFSDGVQLGGIAMINDGRFTDGVPDVNMVFSVIDTEAPSDIFAHEIGHLLGCRHLKEDDPHGFANAYEICTLPISGEGQNFCAQYMSTVMDGNADVSRVLRFSNPEGLYQEFATGTEDHNNARMIAQTACPISLFGGMVEGGFADPPFNANATGPLYIYHDNIGSFTYSSYYEGCQDGIVEYHWEISWDHQNTFQTLSYEEDAILPAVDVPQNQPTGFIRLTASCTEEPDEVVRVLQLTNWSAWNLKIDPNGEDSYAVRSSRRVKAGRISETSDEGALSIFPNPVKNILCIESETVALNDLLEVNLYSVQGTRYDFHKNLLSEQSTQLSIDVGSMVPGFYILELKSTESYFHQPIIIVH